MPSIQFKILDFCDLTEEFVLFFFLLLELAELAELTTTSALKNPENLRDFLSSSS